MAESGLFFRFGGRDKDWQSIEDDLGTCQGPWPHQGGDTGGGTRRVDPWLPGCAPLAAWLCPMPLLCALCAAPLSPLAVLWTPLPLADSSWLESVKPVFKYFEERTPGTLMELQVPRPWCPWIHSGCRVPVQHSRIQASPNAFQGTRRLVSEPIHFSVIREPLHAVHACHCRGVVVCV